MSSSSFKVLLTDIEGTTTSINFVKNILFPYAAEHVEEFIRKLAKENDKEFQRVSEELINASNSQAEEGDKIGPEDKGEALISKLVNNVSLWIRFDRKYTALKSLQGQLWEEGYRNGQIKAHVYPDVPKAFAKLKASGIPIYIYSSGSVKAQKLLFAHTNHGDLTTFISGYFDTNVGPKMEAGSYGRIVEQIGGGAVSSPSDVLFLTDVEKEAIAADTAGLQAHLLVREGNEPLSENATKKFKTLTTFDQLIQ